ncbi:MAG: element excision factor XisI family protein [Anaerolineae bacterium]|nr:element excision factor XisI family protein [Anaerolineae bacterium]MDQ7033294.1 element excision factor XisI family protein [Anaerolineae bacterium]
MNILRTEIEKYTGEALNGQSYLAENIDSCLFTVISIGEFKGKHVSFADLIVRVVGDKIVIDDDRNSDPFYEALMQAGIAREQIILAYAGEPVPDMA